MSMQLDMRQFNETLARYLAVCPRTIEEILNKKLLFIAVAAYKLIPKADRSDIERNLDVIGYEVRQSKKTGKMKKGRAIVGAPILYKIVNAMRGRKGEKGLYGAEMKKAAQKELSSRFRAIGSLRSGLVAPIKTLAAKAKEFLNLEKLPSVKQRGQATPAQPGWNPEASFQYNLAINKGNGMTIDPRVESAVAQGFAQEAASMEEYIIKRMQKDADKINAP
jgi:hypothetical protein